MAAHTKQQLRSIYREKRMALSPERLEQLNGQLLEQFTQLDFSQYRTLHVFLPIPGNNEPDTYTLVDWLRHTHPLIRIVISRSNPANLGMDHFVWDAHTVLVPNRWGIPEPVEGTPALPGEIDAIVIPLLAFDKLGHRVGYGKGFYDRFLMACRPDTLKIGLSLFDPVDHITDVNPFDVALNCCVTPMRVWRF